MKQVRVHKFIFLVVFALLALLLLWVFSPFFSTLLWSLLVYIIVNPIYQRLIRRFPLEKRTGGVLKRVSAAFFALISILFIVLPMVFIFKEVLRQSFQLVQLVENMVRKYRDFLRFGPEDPLVLIVKDITLGSYDLSKFNLSEQILSAIREGASLLLRTSTMMLRNFTNFVITLSFMVFTLYFLLVDGDYLLRLFMRAVPLETKHLQVFIRNFRETVLHLLRGYFLVALYQSAMAFILFYLFDIPGYLLLSLVVFFFAFIPMIGATGVWLPVTFYKLAVDGHVSALFLGILSAILISTVDNFLRPFILKDKIKIHPLLIFFSILGALRFFGFQGLILGPMILIFFFAALEIFIEIFQIDKSDGEDPYSSARR